MGAGSREMSRSSSALSGKVPSRQEMMQKKPMRNQIRIKVIAAGEAGVGKSCLIKRYCEGKFVSKYISTIGVDFGVKCVMIDDLEVKANFWDLAGHPEYFEIRNEFYKDTQGMLLVFDVNSRQTFERLENWLKEAIRYGAGNLVTILVGNKVDGERRVVSEAEARQFARSQGFNYFETSAATGEKVQELFDCLFTSVVDEARR